MAWLCKTKIWTQSKTVYVNTGFIVYIKRENIYKDAAEDVEAKIDTSNYEIDRPLPNKKIKKSNWINERWVRWKNHEKICWIESKNIKLLNRWR